MQTCVNEPTQQAVYKTDELTCIPLDAATTSDLFDLGLKLNNLKDLKTLQKIMNEEENKNYSLDDVLSKVLNFYGKFVPFN